MAKLSKPKKLSSSPAGMTIGDLPLPEHYADYKKLVEIDREDLEKSLEDQPRLFSEVSEYASKWAAIRDLRKRNAEEVQARVDKEIRDEAIEGNVKLTETAIFNQVKEDDDYKEAQRTFLEAKYFADLWAGLKESYQQRSYALKDLVAIAVRQMTMDSDVIASERDRQTLLEARSKQVSRLRSEKLKTKK